ncbi:DUF6732 family protein [Celeribacter arenosi]|uniref:Uncharacterized protein n=1 Tax=Celeribacter arenosi TaxID=792649 RepID=A0ABP7JZG1_9RHOB
MSRVLLPLFVLAAPAANAHPGHLIEQGGHDHWIAGIAVGIAIGAVLWGAVKGRKPAAQAAPESEQEAGEAQEA